MNIPKGNGKTRPLGIPTFEDKVLQKAVKMVIEPIFEHDFLDCSYGFRSGRSQHMALQFLRNSMMEMRGGWIIDLDISKYFDSINHKKLREIVKQRVCDGVITRLIGKWLKAGILEEEQLRYAREGTPQGGVISPLLSNIYLHEVLDLWFEREVKPRMKGKAFIVRYADDAVLGFENKEDALRVYEVLPKRLEKYDLELHPEKTKLIKFTMPQGPDDGKQGKRATFDFLGFTHYWAKSRKGRWVIKQKTAKGRLARTITKFNTWLRKHRHSDIRKQWRYLTRALVGHYNYYGVISNYLCLDKVFRSVTECWKYWLSRRSQKSYLSWVKYHRLLDNYPLPRPRVVHSPYTAKL